MNGMKIRKMVLAMCMGMMSLAMCAQQTSDEQQERCGTLVFDSLSVDMGLLEKDSAAVAVFRFHVEGNAPVAIQCAAASCHCTTVTYSREPYQPGKEGEIRVRYDSRGMPPGYFKKVVVVRSNASAPLMRLSVSGRVKRAKRIKPL